MKTNRALKKPERNASPSSAQRRLSGHLAALHRCRLCPDVQGPVVSCPPVLSHIILVGQAPGSREGDFGKPFAWTAGKTLFRWFEAIGLPEEALRRRIFISAVCRCFPGRDGKHDRVPSEVEISNCSRWLDKEIALLHPALLIPVGKLAISRFLPVQKLDSVIGRQFELEASGVALDIIPLPHPSGASTWHRREPGKTLLARAMKLIARHAEFKRLLEEG